MNGKSIACCGAALLAGAALGWFLKPAPGAAEGAPAAAAPKVRGKIADAGDAAKVAALQARIADLEASLRAARGQRAEAKADRKGPRDGDAAPAGARGREGERRMGMRERLAELEAKDPKRYAQITNRMARMRRNRAANAAAKREYLASVDTARMGAAEKKTHDQLQELMAKKEALEEQMHDEHLTEDQRNALMEEMHRTDRAMRELNRTERDTLLGQAAQDLGFSGDDATEVVETIKDVIDATESGHGGPPPGPPPDGADAPPDGGTGGPL